MSKYSDRILNTEDKNNSLTQIFDWIKKDSAVFDVGCDEGYFAHLLKTEKNCKVWGLEVNPDAAKEARSVCEEVWENDLDWEDPFRGVNQKFDYIVFADVLEHTKYPARVLEKTKDILNDDGEVLISIPNIAHMSARLELLNGSFEYERTGIFDDTHLKYFTLNTFKNLIAIAGFEPKEISGVFRDVPEEEMKELLENVGLSITEEFIKKTKEFEMQAYQLLFRIKKSQTKSELKVEPNPFKPMTVADDSVRYLRKRINELEVDIEAYRLRIENMINEKSSKEIFKKVKKIIKHKKS